MKRELIVTVAFWFFVSAGMIALGYAHFRITVLSHQVEATHALSPTVETRIEDLERRIRAISEVEILRSGKESQHSGEVPSTGIRNAARVTAIQDDLDELKRTVTAIQSSLIQERANNPYFGERLNSRVDALEGKLALESDAIKTEVKQSKESLTERIGNVATMQQFTWAVAASLLLPSGVYFFTKLREKRAAKQDQPK